jgi:hypothetical protein
MSLISWYFSLKGRSIFLSIVLINLVIIWVSRNLLINEDVFYSTFSEQLTYERSIMMYDDLKKISWVGYVIYPLILLIKVSLVSVIIYVGIFFFGNQDNFTLGSVFKVVLASEIAFILASLIKFCWFCFIDKDYNINDMNFFYPLSLINFFRRSEIMKIWIYPLQTVNLFHLLYILLLSLGLNKVCLIGKPESEKIVLASYIPVIILWNVIIMFLLIDQIP